MDAADKRIESLVRGLRGDPVAEAPEALIFEVIAARPRTLPPARLAMRISVALAAIAFVVFSMLPRESVASVMQRLTKALSSQSFVHVETFLKSEKGDFFRMSEMNVHGRNSRLVWSNHAGDRSTVDGRTTIYYKEAGFAIIEDATFFPEVPNLAGLLTIAPQGTKLLESNKMQWKGKKVDRYVVELREPKSDGTLRTSKMVIYADPRTDRPLFIQRGTGRDTVQVTLAYPRPDPKLVKLDLPPGVPVFDLQKQRRQLWDTIVLGDQVQVVGGVRVTLRAAVYDVSNEELMVITTGGEGRVMGAPEVLKVAGLPTGTEKVTPFSGIRPGNAVVDGVVWEGLRLQSEGVTFPKGTKIPSQMKISVPVWKQDESRPLGRRFAGYAVFNVKQPLRTSTISNLVYPQNKPFFELGKARGGQ